MMQRLRQYFITGLLVWLPMGVTVWVLLWLLGILDSIFQGVLGAIEAMIPGAVGLAEKLRHVPGLGVILVAGTAALTPLFKALGSYDPVWADAWTFVGSLLATWGMAKGWTEFWLVWVAVDLVGVPLLFSAGYYASAFMYVFYGAFTLAGFFVWWRARRRESGETAPKRTATQRLLDIALLAAVVGLAGFYVGHLLPATQPVTWWAVLPIGAFGFVAFIALALIRTLARAELEARASESAAPVTHAG